MSFLEEGVTVQVFGGILFLSGHIHIHEPELMFIWSQAKSSGKPWDTWQLSQGVARTY